LGIKNNRDAMVNRGGELRLVRSVPQAQILLVRLDIWRLDHIDGYPGTSAQ